MRRGQGGRRAPLTCHRAWMELIFLPPYLNMEVDRGPGQHPSLPHLSPLFLFMLKFYLSCIDFKDTDSL